ncbi:MAG: ABC transporter substrate-binding protein [Anaerolineae bacterium]|nr:ABC transporter substrate-binding protein [Anaerolineae bacterium]
MKRSVLVLLILLALVVGAFAQPAKAQELTKIRLQLKWVAQAQFAGYYAAAAKGFYKEAGLDVEIMPLGGDLAPEQVVGGGNADIGIDWLDSLLVFREQGLNIVNIAQVYTRSGMRQISFKENNITKISDLKGKKVSVWFFGNQYELLAALIKNGMDPENPADVEVIQQPFDMSLLLNGDVVAAAAMTYNELAQVLETINPATGKLYTLDELNIIDYNDPEVGTAMVDDGLFATEEWLAANEDAAVAFLAATFKGWAYCRDNVEECTQIVVDAGTALPYGHQLWQMNEVNKLIWPNEKGLGIMDEAAYKQTVEVALTNKIIEAEPTGAYRTDLAEKALESLGADFDAFGKDYAPITVELKEGGK